METIYIDLFHNKHFLELFETEYKKDTKKYESKLLDVCTNIYSKWIKKITESIPELEYKITVEYNFDTVYLIIKESKELNIFLQNWHNSHKNRQKLSKKYESSKGSFYTCDYYHYSLEELTKSKDIVIKSVAYEIMILDLNELYM